MPFISLSSACRTLPQLVPQPPRTDCPLSLGYQQKNWQGNYFYIYLLGCAYNNAQKLKLKVPK
jgi:hypothetical protein